VEGKDGKSRPARKPAIIAKDTKEAGRARDAIDKMTCCGGVLPNRTFDVKRVERIARDYRVEQAVPQSDAALPSDIVLRIGDLETALADVPDHSVPLIVTDPPYLGSELDCWWKLAKLASRLLCDGGVLLSYSGQLHLDKVMTALVSELQYHWMLALYCPGPETAIHARFFKCQWKPILAFTRRGCNRREAWTGDVVRQGPDKRLHAWQQSEDQAAWLIETFSKPGELVVDPFVGSGTTAAAAIRLGRRFIGCDINSGCIAITQERLLAVQNANKETA
jgi:hypothetical protein